MPGVSVIEQEKVPETVDAQKVMGSMIEQDGASLIFPTSFGYFDPHMLKMAEKYPKVRFAHCGGMWTAGKHPLNTGSYFADAGRDCFYPEVVVVFTIADPDQHYHVPVLLNPFGYGTYRGT